MTRLHDLYELGGQSPWIDDLKRSYVRDGELARLVEQGIRGVTSNPTIMAHAIEAGNDYDKQFGDLISAGSSIADAYWDLVLFDVKGALAILRPVFDDAGGADGFVSVEVDPDLAHDEAGTLAAARMLHDRISQPNLFVKIPATVEGVGAIESSIAEGRSINVTLIFSLARYSAVIEAYLSGLERFVGAEEIPPTSHRWPPSSSLASTPRSTVDSRRSHRARERARLPSVPWRCAAPLHWHRPGARINCSPISSRPSDSPPSPLKARAQRPLWASTSTKNPGYPDLLYVAGLIGPDTVDTMPDATVAAFLDHGVVSRTVDTDPDGARRTLEALAEVGVDLDQVTTQLEQEGVASFSKSFEEVGERLENKAADLKAK